MPVTPPTRRSGIRRSSGRTGPDGWAWGLRLAWIVLPFTLGPLLATAVGGLDPPVRTVVSLEAWVAWTVAMVAAFIAHPAALTALRLGAGAALGAAAAAASSALTLGGGVGVVALTAAVAAAALSFSTPVAYRWVNGFAYPNERRFPLRTPAPLLFGPLALTAAAICAGIAGGPLLIAADRIVLGVAATVVGWPLAWLLARSVHNLARRWVVFVPAGVVLHDPMALVDPVLFSRQNITGLTAGRGVSGENGPSGEIVDLSLRAPGLALRLTFSPATSLSLLRPGHRLGRQVKVTSLVFTPVRPGQVMQEARRRRLAGLRPSSAP